MSRIIFNLPALFSFSTELPIYISHINGAGHLDNAAFVVLLSEARTRFFESTGFGALSLGELSLVAADLVVQYKSQAYYGEVLRFELTPADFNRYGFDVVFKVTEQTQGREVARGKVGIVFVRKDTGKAAPTPELVLAALGAKTQA